jgi:hypothetical protein
MVGPAEPVEFAHEVPRRVHLLVRVEHRRLGQRRIEDERCRCGEQYAGRVARVVPDDLAARRGIVEDIGNSDREEEKRACCTRADNTPLRRGDEGQFARIMDARPRP